MRTPLRLAAAFAAAVLLCCAPEARALGSPPDSLPSPVPPDSGAFQIRWHAHPVRGCAPDSVRLEFRWCESCVHVVSISKLGDGGARVVFEPLAVTGCANACFESHRALTYGEFDAGFVQLGIDLVARLPGGGEQTTRVYAGTVIPARCGDDSLPPMPFIHSIAVETRDGRVPCPSDSPVVVIDGVFPSECYRFALLALEPVYCITWPCPPPVLHMVVDDGGCLGRPCVQEPVSFVKKLVMPPLPSGSYVLGATMAVVSCPPDSTPIPPQYFAATAFSVASDSACGPPPPGESCLSPNWHLLGPPACDATVSPEQPAELTLRIRSDAAIAGLQGRLRLSSDALRIAALATTPATAGWTLTWNVVEDGAEFVMFSADGTPAGSGPRRPAASVANDSMPPNPFPAAGLPFLDVTVTIAPGATAPDVTRLHATELLGADTLSRAVPQCPEIAAVVPLPSVARICADRPCDANGDGRSDVRDLVTMIRCLHRQCPDSLRYDCDDDSTFALDDVMCCARRILRRAPGDTTHGRPAPEVAIELGALERDGADWVLPVTFRGGIGLGAARLDLSLPLDRFDVIGTDVGESGWMTLHETGSNALALGLLAVDDFSTARPGSPDVHARVRLALKSGQSAGGAFGVTGGEFTDANGVALEVELPAPAIPSVLALAPARPNPFASSTSFVLDLDRASDVDVSVHDLSGRRIATLRRGALPAGRHTITWDGGGSAGRVADGVYFLRASVDGQVLGRKVAMLRSR